MILNLRTFTPYLNSVNIIYITFNFNSNNLDRIQCFSATQCSSFFPALIWLDTLVWVFESADAKNLKIFLHNQYLVDYSSWNTKWGGFFSICINWKCFWKKSPHQPRHILILPTFDIFCLLFNQPTWFIGAHFYRVSHSNRSGNSMLKV